MYNKNSWGAVCLLAILSLAIYGCGGGSSSSMPDTPTEQVVGDDEARLLRMMKQPQWTDAEMLLSSGGMKQAATLKQPQRRLKQAKLMQLATLPWLMAAADDRQQCRGPTMGY